VSNHDGIVFKLGDGAMLEMPNGKFRDNFMITDSTVGAGKGLSAGLVWFAPGNHEGHPDMHEVDEVFYIIAGRGRFVADGVEHLVEAGDVVYCPAGMEHTYLTDESPLHLFWCITSGWESMEESLLSEIAETWREVPANEGWHTAIA
jgi:mannose-6-phosphate isomerase-like protein (cupin superfamily)